MSPYCGAHQPRHLGSRLMGFFLPEIPQKRSTASLDNVLGLPFNFVYSPGDEIRQYKKTDKSAELPCPPTSTKRLANAATEQIPVDNASTKLADAMPMRLNSLASEESAEFILRIINYPHVPAALRHKSKPDRMLSLRREDITQHCFSGLLLSH